MYRKMYIGKIIRELRGAYHFSLEKLAGLAHMDPSALSRLERNINQPTMYTIFLLAAAFGMKASELVAIIEANIEMVLIQE